MILSFKNPSEFKRWLAKNHKSSDGLWIRLFKVNSGEKTISHPEALDIALCYGWIDAQIKKYDKKSWLRRFCPRRPKSPWSKTNTAHVKRLMKEKKMAPAGLKAVSEAQKDGRWKLAYDSPKNLTIPPDFMKALEKNKKAKKFFDTLNRANLYTISYRLQTAKKPEIRARRMQVILERLESGKKFH
jgi:uncharacterized protein YdeI (YjbR/CyaY-like superfamily)